MDSNERSAPAAQLTGLTKHFSGGRVRAVDGIDLTIGRGEIVALLGPNGAGKTTTLDMLLGLTNPTGGTVEVLGQGPAHAVAAGRLGALLQTGGLPNDLRVREVVDYVDSTYRTPTVAGDVLDRARISHLADRKVSLCSGGEQQRLKFALALLPDPEFLVLDEPTAGMDVAARRSFWETMRAEASRGRTIVFATHYLEEAEMFAERVVLMAGGRIVADGRTEEIRHLTGIRQVTARAADEDGLRRALDGALPGLDYTLEWGKLTAKSDDSDALARLLLSTDGVDGLEISAPSLEEAFMGLLDEEDAS